MRVEYHRRSVIEKPAKRPRLPQGQKPKAIENVAHHIWTPTTTGGPLAKSCDLSGPMRKSLKSVPGTF